MAATSQIITDLKGFGATPEVIGYFTALQTVGYITPPGLIALSRAAPEYVPGPAPKLDELKGRPPRNRGTMSKTAEAIVAKLVPEGMSKRRIVEVTGLTAKQVETALPAMQKNGYAYVKNSRWFAGSAPVKRVGRPAGTTKTPAKSAKKTGISLSDATLKAVQANRDGATAKNILNYLSREFAMTIRPNHLGIALTRHGKAGRLEKRDGMWYVPNVEELRPTG